MQCVQCGQPIYGVRCGYCESVGAVGAMGKGNAITWPFHYPGWFASLWMPLIGSFLWPFGLLISLGWSVEAIGRRARGAAQPLPQMRNLARILKHGFVVVAMIFLYFVIPLAILYKLVEFSWVVEVWHLILALWQAFTGTSKTPLISSVLEFLFKLLANSTAPIIYLLIASPLFLVARLRYALTGQIRSFFNLFGNIAICLHYIGEILLYLFLAIVTKAAIGFILAVVAATVLGVVIPVVMGAASVWIMAYLATAVAREMYERDGIGAGDGRLAPAPAAAHIPAAYIPDAVRELKPVLEPAPLSLPAHARSSPVLYCRRGALKDKQFPVSPEGYTIGRSPSHSQIIISEREVSSEHVRVKADPATGGVWIEDMHSTNGTYYRCGSEPWQRLTGRIRLPSGGRFKLSRDVAEFEIQEG